MYNAMRELMRKDSFVIETSGEYQTYATVLKWIENINKEKEKE